MQNQEKSTPAPSNKVSELPSTLLGALRAAVACQRNTKKTALSLVGRIIARYFLRRNALTKIPPAPCLRNYSAKTQKCTVFGAAALENPKGWGSAKKHCFHF